MFMSWHVCQHCSMSIICWLNWYNFLYYSFINWAWKCYSNLYSLRAATFHAIYCRKCSAIWYLILHRGQSESLHNYIYIYIFFCYFSLEDRMGSYTVEDKVGSNFNMYSVLISYLSGGVSSSVWALCMEPCKS